MKIYVPRDAAARGLGADDVAAAVAELQPDVPPGGANAIRVGEVQCQPTPNTTLNFEEIRVRVGTQTSGKHSTSGCIGQPIA